MPVLIISHWLYIQNDRNPCDVAGSINFLSLGKNRPFYSLSEHTKYEKGAKITSLKSVENMCSFQFNSKVMHVRKKGETIKNGVQLQNSEVLTKCSVMKERCEKNVKTYEKKKLLSGDGEHTKTEVKAYILLCFYYYSRLK